MMHMKDGKESEKMEKMEKTGTKKYKGSSSHSPKSHIKKGSPEGTVSKYCYKK